ncbi:MAG: LysR substrate-binding domain-containing protein, partial [Pseudomonadota bacterium]
SLRAGIVDSIPKLIAERLLGGALEHEQGVRLKCREGPYEQLLADLAVHRLDVVLADQPVPSGLSLSVYGHRLGRSPLCFMARSELARKLRRRFPQSLNAAPMLLPAPTSALRGRIDRWLDDHDVQPLVVGEFDDSALMKAFGQAGTGVIVAPAAIEAEVRRMYRLVAIGTADTVFEDYFAVTPYKDIRHVAVERLCRNAPTRLAASES